MLQSEVQQGFACGDSLTNENDEKNHEQALLALIGLVIADAIKFTAKGTRAEGAEKIASGTGVAGSALVQAVDQANRVWA